MTSQSHFIIIFLDTLEEADIIQCTSRSVVDHVFIYK